MKIYFSASIKGGRQLVGDYAKMIARMKLYGQVLTEHIGDDKFVSGATQTPQEVYLRDKRLMDECDVVIADVTVPSLGVGYELAYCESKNLPIFCLYGGQENSLSFMVSGNANFTVFHYDGVDEALETIDEIFQKRCRKNA